MGNEAIFVTRIFFVVTLTAKWNATVTFDANGGSAVASQTVREGGTASSPTAPTKSGFIFAGWYTSTDGGTTLSGTAFSFSTAITADTTLYAKWENPFVLVTGATVKGNSKYASGPSIFEKGAFISGRTVEIGDLYVCDHEVTQAEYAQYMTWYGDITNNDSYRPGVRYGKGDNYPAYRMNWYEAVIYCCRVSYHLLVVLLYLYNCHLL